MKNFLIFCLMLAVLIVIFLWFGRPPEYSDADRKAALDLLDSASDGTINHK